MERLPGLTEREVERSAVERPAAVQPGDLAALGLDREQVEPVDPRAELTERPGSGEIVDGPGLLQRDLILGVVDDVLAEPLGSAAVEVDDGAQPLEAARDLGSQALQGVALDVE